jgi:diguanylate cyclase (GGDEF)-like protein
MDYDRPDPPLSRTIASTATLRLSSLHTSDYFYTPIEERFERITRIARHALRVPVAAVTLLRPDKQWFKSVSGWSISELPTDKSMCSWTIEDQALTVVPDTQLDPRFANHPLVAQRPNFRFYAGHPLCDDTGATIGTFCVMDVRPRTLQAGDLQAIRDLAMMSERELIADRLADAQNELVTKLGVARREAMIDALTRLWNRRGAMVFLRNAITRATEAQTELAVGILDLDRFKQINDLHGHQTGDEALRIVARTLMSTLRGSDIVCRYGGDEFIVILQATDARHASVIMNRVREAIQSTPIRTRSGPLSISVSAGCAIRQRDAKSTEEDLIHQADEALRQSKSRGKNRVQIAS